MPWPSRAQLRVSPRSRVLAGSSCRTGSEPPPAAVVVAAAAPAPGEFPGDPGAHACHPRRHPPWRPTAPRCCGIPPCARHRPCPRRRHTRGPAPRRGRTIQGQRRIIDVGAAPVLRRSSIIEPVSRIQAWPSYFLLPLVNRVVPAADHRGGPRAMSAGMAATLRAKAAIADINRRRLVCRSSLSISNASSSSRSTRGASPASSDGRPIRGILRRAGPTGTGVYVSLPGVYVEIGAPLWPRGGGR